MRNSTFGTASPSRRSEGEWLGLGASNFPIDPDRHAAQAPALWRAECNPAVILFAGKPPSRNGLILAAEQIVGAVTHCVLDDDKFRHRLRIIEPSGAQHFHIPDDGNTAVRSAALTLLKGQFDRTAIEIAAARKRLYPTHYQHQRLELLLAVLDEDDVVRRPSLKDIAREVIYPGLPELRAIEWKSSTHRRHTQRVVAEARRMRDSGYRALLRLETEK